MASGVHPYNIGKLPMCPQAPNSTLVLNIILNILSAGVFEDVVVTISSPVLKQGILHSVGGVM